MSNPTGYFKIKGHVISAEDKAFSRIRYRSSGIELEESDTTSGVFDFKYEATTGGVTLDLSGYQNFTHMLVENLDETNRVKVEYTSTAGTCKHWLDAGDWMMVPAVSTQANMTLTAENASVDVRIVALSALTDVPA